MFNELKIKMQLSTISKTVFAIMAAGSLFINSGCGSGAADQPAATDVPQGMVAADLSSFGIPVLVNVPDSTVGPLELSENPQGGVDVRVGKGFQFTVKEGVGDMTLMKSDITSDAIKKLVKYVVEEPNALIWEWQIDGMEPEFHVYAVVKAGDKSFEVRNIESEVFSEKSATLMLDAAKSIRMKEAPKAES